MKYTCHRICLATAIAVGKKINFSLYIELHNLKYYNLWGAGRNLSSLKQE